MKVKILALLSAALILAQCAKKREGGISATVTYSEEVLVSRISPKQLEPLDTVLITDNQFFYQSNDTAEVFLLFEFPTGARIPIFYKPGDQLQLAINDTNEFGTFSATGSASIIRMAQQRDIFVETARFFDSISYVNDLYLDSTNFGEIRQRLNNALLNRLEVHRQKLEALIDQDTTDLANIMAFYQNLGEIEFFNINRDYSYYKKVDNGLQAQHPNNPHAQYFHDRLVGYKEAVARQKRIESAAQNLQIGSVAPNISLPNPEGKQLNLSDLQGKVVLIDFWASWCGPCRRANPGLVKLYQDFNNRGLEIFSVSIDGLPSQPNAENDWRFAIENDGLIWPYHVSDLQGHNSPIVELYGFDGIPYNVLIDREGRILAKNLQGEALRSKIAASL